MKNRIHLLTLLGFLFVVNVALAQEENDEASDSFVLGEVVNLKSDILNENRTLNVYLPHTYHRDPNKKYPVIYLLDGAKDEDFIHVAGLVQFGNFPWVELLPEAIVVGIANTDRKRDFTYPTTVEKDKQEFPTTGGSANFIAFLKNEVVPYIESNYKASETSTIVGQSLGGLLLSEILWKHSKIFDNYIVISPSLWWDKESLLSQKPLRALEPEQAVFIAVGQEGPNMERVARELTQALRKNNEGHAHIHFQYFGQLNHATILHLALYDAFQTLFGKIEPPKDEKDNLLAAMEGFSATTGPEGAGADAYGSFLAHNFSRWTMGSDKVVDKEEIVESVRGWFTDGWRVTDRQSTELSIEFRGNLAFTRRIVAESYLGPKGETSSSKSALTEIWTKDTGTWLLLSVNVTPVTE